MHDMTGRAYLQAADFYVGPCPEPCEDHRNRYGRECLVRCVRCSSSTLIRTV